VDAVDRHAALPIYLQVKHQLRDAILDGSLTGRVPSERELARKYGIAQMTARRALGELVHEGILYRQVGRGTFVCGPGAASGLAHAIGVALCPKVADGASNPYFSRVLRGVEQACRGHACSVLFTSAIDELAEAAGAHPASNSRNKVDGVLAVAMDDEDAVRRAARRMPTIALDNEFEGVSCVVADNAAGGYQATSHLLELGHRRIAHLAGHQGSAVGRQRLAGYRRALEDHGVEADPEWVCPCGFDVDAGYAQAATLLALSPPPTAVFCANDAVALGAMKRLREEGLTVPDDISVVGFDDIEAAALVEPALTTIRVPREAIGALAAEMLLAAIRRRDPNAPPERRLVDVELVERASCRPI